MVVLRCPPRFFFNEISAYSHNGIMAKARETKVKIDFNRLMREWQAVSDWFYVGGVGVEELTPRNGMPDLVFTANGSTAHNGRVIIARYRFPERQQESAVYETFFRGRGYEILNDYIPMPEHFYFEGWGDVARFGRNLIFTYGVRSNLEALPLLQNLFPEKHIIAVKLADAERIERGEIERENAMYYHGDLCIFTVPACDSMAWYGDAISQSDRVKLHRIPAETFFFTDREAEAMIANAVACGNRVALPAGPRGEHERFQTWLTSRGCEVSVFETSQSLPAGGTLIGCATQFIEYDA